MGRNFNSTRKQGVSQKLSSISLGKGHSLVMGKQSVLQLLTHGNVVKRVFIEESNSKELKKIKEKFPGYKYLNVSSDELRALCNSTSHQGIAAEIKERRYFELAQFLERFEEHDDVCLMVLDEISDPQNFGTLLRCAECFGVSGVVYSKNRCPPITPVVTKASVGATELVNLLPVSNIHHAVGILKKAGFWTVASLLDDKAVALSSFEFPKRTALLVGAEGEGLHDLIKKEADFSVKIQQVGLIQSLNVSQATSIFLYEYHRQVTNNLKKPK